MVKEVSHFIADGDPEETPFDNLQDAQRHENRLRAAVQIGLYLEANLYGQEAQDITLQSRVELVAFIARQVASGAIVLE